MTSNIYRLKLIEDGGSPTGWSIESFSEPGKLGIPASPFEAYLWEKLVAARYENRGLKRQLRSIKKRLENK